MEDELSSLEIPAEESVTISPPRNGTQSGSDASQLSTSRAEAPSSSKSEHPPATPSQPSLSSRSKPQKQTYPLYPSIVQLLHEKGLSPSEADKIPATGPKGRLLKGDVLAYLGRISSSYSSEQSARITRLGHLDLSNVKAAAPKKVLLPPASESQPSAAQEPEATEIEVAVPVSLSSVLSVQKRIQATLGVTLPLATFVARATELANGDLPHPGGPPTADALFHDVLGLSKISSNASKGHYVPQMTALPNVPFASAVEPQRQPDVYDILTGNASSPVAAHRGDEMPPPGIMADSNLGEATNVFSVNVTKAEEKRAKVFLERVKTVLQVEPGRLIL